MTLQFTRVYTKYKNIALTQLGTEAHSNNISLYFSPTNRGASTKNLKAAPSTAAAKNWRANPEPWDVGASALMEHKSAEEEKESTRKAKKRFGREIGDAKVRFVKAIQKYHDDRKEAVPPVVLRAGEVATKVPGAKSAGAGEQTREQSLRLLKEKYPELYETVPKYGSGISTIKVWPPMNPIPWATMPRGRNSTVNGENKT